MSRQYSDALPEIIAEYRERVKLITPGNEIMMEDVGGIRAEYRTGAIMEECQHIHRVVNGHDLTFDQLKDVVFIVDRVLHDLALKLDIDEDDLLIRLCSGE